MIERRQSQFTERLSMVMVVIAAIGGFLILIDPQITTGNIGGWSFKFGSDGFSQELKGAVVTIMLLAGWTAVKEYWLGASAGGQKQSESVSRIAEGVSAAPASDALKASADQQTKAASVQVIAAEQQLQAAAEQTAASKPQEKP